MSNRWAGVARSSIAPMTPNEADGCQNDQPIATDPMQIAPIGKRTGDGARKQRNG